MTQSIALLTPAVDTGAIPVEHFIARYRALGWKLDNHFLEEGPESIETEADVTRCLPEVIALGRDLEARKAAAIVINCMCDPGVAELRRDLAIPVLGPAEYSMHFLAGCGLAFSVLDVLDDAGGEVRAQVRDFGLDRHFISHRAINVPVLEIQSDPERSLALLEGAARRAAEDGAGALLLGCTGFADIARALNERLRSSNAPPLYEPLDLTLHAARVLVSQQ